MSLFFASWFCVNVTCVSFPMSVHSIALNIKLEFRNLLFYFQSFYSYFRPRYETHGFERRHITDPNKHLRLVCNTQNIKLQLCIYLRDYFPVNSQKGWQNKKYKNRYKTDVRTVQVLKKKLCHLLIWIDTKNYKNSFSIWKNYNNSLRSFEKKEEKKTNKKQNKKTQQHLGSLTGLSQTSFKFVEQKLNFYCTIATTLRTSIS